MKAVSFVLSPSKFYRYTLSSLIEKEVGINCTSIPEMSLKLIHASGNPEIERVLLLLDYAAYEDEVWDYIDYLQQNYNISCPLYIILLNVERDLEVEMDAMSKGLVGVLFQDDSIELLLKSVYKVLQGELWYSRKALGQYFKRFNCNVTAQSDSKEDINLFDLTKREKEILLLMVQGNTNDMIASTLNISASTVKTHIYNAFRKINVTNRIQATKWTIDNLVSI